MEREVVFLKIFDLNSSEALILVVLAGGERYANEIVKLCARQKVQTHRSTVHYVLRRLVQQKLVATRWQILSKNGGREEELRYYRLTGRGQARLERYRAILTMLCSALPPEPGSRPNLEHVAGL